MLICDTTSGVRSTKSADKAETECDAEAATCTSSNSTSTSPHLASCFISAVALSDMTTSA
jgi:hypothetical protein